MRKEVNFRDSSMTEKLEADEEKYIKDYYISEYYLEHLIHDESEKTIDHELQKARFITHVFLEDNNLMELFISLKDFEVKFI